MFLFSPKNFLFLLNHVLSVAHSVESQDYQAGFQLITAHIIFESGRFRDIYRSEINTTQSHCQQINASISERCGQVKNHATSKLQNSQKKYWFWCTNSISALLAKQGDEQFPLATHMETKRLSSLISFFIYYSLHLQSLHVVTGYCPIYACQGSLNIFLKMAKKVIIVWKKTFLLPRSSAHHVPIFSACCQ